MMARVQIRGRQGSVYLWELGDGQSGPGRAIRSIVPLQNLCATSDGPQSLSGRFVSVRNAGVVNQPDPVTGKPVPVPLGNAQPNDDGHFLFEAGRGGGRVDRVEIADEGFRWRYLQAARFGEVNVYHHIDRIASYAQALLTELGGPELPPAIALVNAHHAAIQAQDGDRDGVHRSDGRWVPFQGGHYRLPGRSTIVPEKFPIARNGEIHFGPGQQLARHGALPDLIGGAYRANASHNPGIIYHEYGHHITRHTADFRANGLRKWDRQSNKKTGLDEGMADYWAAALLGTPDIWFFHHQHDGLVAHPRSLRSSKTMEAFSRGSESDPHSNGTIWASALWEIRDRAKPVLPEGAVAVDRLVVQALLIIGQRLGGQGASPTEVGRARRSFRAAGCALLEADTLLYRRALRDTIVGALRRRGIDPEGSREPHHNPALLVQS
jgi:hypothetical protein